MTIDFYKLYVTKSVTSGNVFYMTKEDYENEKDNLKLLKVLYRYGTKTLFTINK